LAERIDRVFKREFLKRELRMALAASAISSVFALANPKTEANQQQSTKQSSGGKLLV